MPRLSLLAIVLLGCTTLGSSKSNDPEEPVAWAPGPAANERPSEARPRFEPAASAEPPLRAVELFEDGDRSPVEAPPREAIALDLSDDWVPLVLRGSVTGLAPSYREDYLAAARDPNQNLAVYGVLPALPVVRERLEQSERHECHDRLRDGSLAEVEGTFVGWPGHRERQRTRRDTVGRLRNRLEGLIAAQGELEDTDAEDSHEAELASLRARLEELEPKVLAIREAQAHLRCDGLLSASAEDAVIDGPTREALKKFQARNGLLPTQQLDPDTRRTMRVDSRELDFMVLLRILRERVADAAGLLADGSARNERGTVFDHHLDGEALRTPPNDRELPNPAPDRVSRATEEAAIALGWTDPQSALEHLQGLERDPPDGPVAVRVSELPSSPNAPLEIRAEIDRGDVYYDFPFTRTGRRRQQPMDELPALTIYVSRDGEEEAAVRWPTTIGMWAQEQNGQHVGLRYEESPVGHRVWRDMIVAPRWLPPRGIPDRSLLTRREGRWQADYETVGPGPSSAYGLVMLVHHLEREPEEEGGTATYYDQGIRTHGTGNLRSIVESHQGSHGCHRVFNINVLRLSAFLLRHRTHIHYGEVEVQYDRPLRDGGHRARLMVDSRGYRIELDPPIPVDVLPGEIHGDRRRPIEELRPLPEVLRERAREAEEAQQPAESPESVNANES